MNIKSIKKNIDTSFYFIRDDIETEKVIQIDTFFHEWILGLKSGNAYSKKKTINPLGTLFTLITTKKTEYSIYDYFTSPEHIRASVAEGQKFIQNILVKNHISIEGKRILDISGGNGHVADELRKCGANVVMTEVNNNAIDYAKNTLGIESYPFDFQKSEIYNIVDGKFDIILLRASIMFCFDLNKFFSDLKKIMKPDSIIVLQYCIKPTLGTFLATEFDQFTYVALYQPETLIDVCIQNNLSLLYREDDIDPSLYVNDHDKNISLTLIRMWYEIKALKVIPLTDTFLFRARNRRRANLIFTLKTEFSN